jgi:purine-binding chemotaxis protein CheW
MAEINDAARRGTRWSEVRERLARVEAALAGSLAPDARAIEEVYRRRASQLAARPAAAAEAATIGILVFALGTERYAIELSHLAEVFPLRACTAVPGAPPELLGVINVRGDIRAVLDLGRVLNPGSGGSGATGYVVMLRRQRQPIGLRVDAIEDVRQIDASQLTTAPTASDPVAGSRFVKALTADTVMLIDTAAALASVD